MDCTTMAEKEKRNDESLISSKKLLKVLCK